MFGLFWPFDDADCFVVEIVTKSGFDEFFRLGHSIQIKMDYFNRFAIDCDGVWLSQRVSGTFDMARMACGMEQ